MDRPVVRWIRTRRANFSLGSGDEVFSERLGERRSANNMKNEKNKGQIIILLRFISQKRIEAMLAVEE
jgi:hypothetical protein